MHFEWDRTKAVANRSKAGHHRPFFAPTALHAVGAHQCAAIVEKALALVPAPLPTEHDACWEAMHSLPGPAAAQFQSLDDRFFAYPDDLTELLFAFVSAHPDVFGSTPTEK